MASCVMNSLLGGAYQHFLDAVGDSAADEAERREPPCSDVTSRTQACRMFPEGAEVAFGVWFCAFILEGPAQPQSLFYSCWRVGSCSVAKPTHLQRLFL